MTHHADNADIPVILFGAFDRHNFGDLLFPHVAAALLDGKNLIFTGLAERDLRCHGGHQVKALAPLARYWGKRPVNIIHAGGELLTCDAWQAAVMLLPQDQAQQNVVRFDKRPLERLEWAHRMLEVAALAPYTMPSALFPGAASMIYNAVGGVDLDERDPALRGEVLAKLKAADEIGVRDVRTQAVLAAAGIAARLMPDPAVMVQELFGAKIRQHSQQGELAQILQAFSKGYIAAQFSVDFGDDKTLDTIAGQLDRAAVSSKYGIVLFRAGAAPWHDELRYYESVAARMHTPVKIFASLDLWDICALIAHSRLYAGSSLHGRIVAMAFALPRINLRHPGQSGRCTKQDAFAASWEAAGVPASVDVHEIARGIGDALAADPVQLLHTAQELVTQYRRGFNALCAALK